MFREFVAAKRRAEDEAERATVHAWLVANFGAAAVVGKLPPLDEVLARQRLHRQQTAEQQLARLEVLGAHLGLSVKPMSESTKRALLRLKESRG